MAYCIRDKLDAYQYIDVASMLEISPSPVILFRPNET